MRWLTIVTSVCLTFAGGSAWAQLASNQTNGFGNGRLVTFTYLQNFDCVDQPLLDLDFNHIPAQSDPNEMQTPSRGRHQAHRAFLLNHLIPG